MDHWRIQFKSFHWLSLHGTSAKPCSTNGGRFCFVLVFNMLFLYVNPLALVGNERVYIQRAPLELLLIAATLAVFKRAVKREIYNSP